jgi:hypothetical protein
MTSYAMPRSYWVFRSLVFTEGALSLLLGLLSGLLPSSDTDPSPSPQYIQTLLVIGATLVSVSYVLPNRWGIMTPLFGARVVLSVLAAIRVLYMSTLLATGFFGEKHWLLYPVLLLAASGVAAAPALLVARRRRHLRAMAPPSPENPVNPRGAA